ncbi:rhamnogalacturonan acetylesterase [Microbacterium gilvum]|uniref:Rhamnogalacturonan acetylesterase n=1 Tax=Microbacterium gilvum TaxID=1336204 RepID=A0ABP8ZZ86_9MICO
MSAISRRGLFTSLVSAGASAATRVAPRLGLDVRTLFLAGDATSASSAVRPFAGWGMALPWHATPHLRVENHAADGCSSRSFLDEGRLEALLRRVRPGDIVLAQFGHEDERSDHPDRYTEPWTGYRRSLARFVDAARERGATTVLATPVERRRFTSSGDAYESHGEYPAAMRALAASMRVPLVDVQAESLALWQRLGPEATKTLFVSSPGRRDHAHLHAHGAAAIARIVAAGLLARGAVEPHEVRRLDEVTPLSAFAWRASAA